MSFRFCVLAAPFNQPKSCPTAKWNRTATTFINTGLYGSPPNSIFATTSNTIYVTIEASNKILVTDADSADPMIVQGREGWAITSVFVSNNSEIYIDSLDGKIVKWMPSTNNFVDVVDFKTDCFYLFIDINNYLYCSSTHHLVTKIRLDHEMKTIDVAGTGKTGSAPDEFNHSKGIFVDTNLDLYVADSVNHRIQQFSLGNKTGKTVAGESSSDITIELCFPSSILLDADKYLFIADTENHRIVASSPNGFRCLVGCGERGKESYQLNGPLTFSFDVHGNMFVCDVGNERIQKFNWQKDFCSKYRIVQRENSFR